MNFDDIKDRLLAPLKNIWSEFQESNLFISLKEKYESLNPISQKSILFGAIALVVFIVLSVPLGDFQTSQETMADFTDKKELVRELLRLQRNQAQAPNVPPAPSSSELKSRIGQMLQEQSLAPEQIVQNEETSVGPEPPLIPAPIEQKGVNLMLAKLNLRQVIDLGYAVQSVNGAHLISMEVKANAQNNHYFDVMFRLVGFSIPETAEDTGTGGGKKAKPAPKKGR